MAKCVLCGRRKGKRLCRAVYNYICPQCCATHRLTKFQCPHSCPYLIQAQLITIQRREEDLAERTSERSEAEFQAASFAVEEAIATFASQDQNLTDADVLQAVRGMMEAIQKEMALGQRITPPLPERQLQLANLIWRNAAVMRENLGIPHNALLMRALQRVADSVVFQSERTKDPKGYIKFLRTYVRPGSLRERLGLFRQELSVLSV